MRRWNLYRRFAPLFVALAALLGLSDTRAYTGLPDIDPCDNCIPLARNCEEIIVPLTGTPTMSGCIPAGTYVCGYMKIRNSFSASTCGTKVVSEVTSYGKIVVPGVGEFKACEMHLNSNTVTPTSSEILIVDDSRYRAVGCGESYRMYVKFRMKIRADGPTSQCEAMEVDCYTPCCGND